MTTHSFRRITSADANTNINISRLPGVQLAYITINTTSAHALTVYDGTDTTTLANNSGIAAIKASIVEQTLIYKIACKKGIVINVPAGYAGDATVCFS